MATKASKKGTKYVYSFGNKKADGNGSMKPLLGGKGANLAEMMRMGVQKRAGEDHEPFETVIDELKAELFPGKEHVEDTALDVAGLKEMVARFKTLVKERTGKAFPNNPWDQLKGAVGAVFNSWMND